MVTEIIQMHAHKFSFTHNIYIMQYIIHTSVLYAKYKKS